MTGDENSETGERIDQLEAHIAHQDETIQDLSDVAMQQWDAIKELRQEIARLKGEMQRLEDSVNTPPGEEPPPPHY